MIGARTFADVLDWHLQPEPLTDTRPAGIATASIWPTSTFFDWPASAGCRTDFQHAGGFACRTAPAKPRRRLTTQQHAALLTLSSAAREPLDSSFDHAVLKRAFRRAARLLHPDAHPAVDLARRRQLESAFASARDAYLTLLALTTN